MIVPAEIEKLNEVTEFIDAFLEEHDCPMKIQMQIDLCLEEMFVNIAHYAYPDGAGKAEILVSESGGIVTITLIDSGLRPTVLPLSSQTFFTIELVFSIL